MRLIDADALKYELFADNYNAKMTNQEVADCIDNSPTIDAVPVVRGEWEDIPNRYVCVAGDRPYHGNATSCSVCHDINPNAFKTNFCPNCGADMRESEAKE